MRYTEAELARLRAEVERLREAIDAIHASDMRITHNNNPEQFRRYWDAMKALGWTPDIGTLRPPCNWTGEPATSRED